jgi:hypothetical protein
LNDPAEAVQSRTLHYVDSGADGKGAVREGDGIFGRAGAGAMGNSGKSRVFLGKGSIASFRNYWLAGASAFWHSSGFENHVEFDDGVEGKGVDADGGAGVFAGFAEEAMEELAGAVGDYGLFGEIVGGLDEDAESDDAGDFGEIAVEFGGGDGEGVDDALGGGGLGEFDGDVGGDFAGGEEGAVAEGELAADEEEVSGADGGEVGADGFGWRGEGMTELGEKVGDVHLRVLR